MSFNFKNRLVKKIIYIEINMKFFDWKKEEIDPRLRRGEALYDFLERGES